MEYDFPTKSRGKCKTQRHTVYDNSDISTTSQSSPLKLGQLITDVMSALIKGLGSLDTSQGYLPLWMAFISGIAVFNAVQNYMTTTLTQKVYSDRPTEVTGLSSRTFGIWTMTSAFIRIFAAANIHDARLYELALISYYIAAFHFGTEVFIYKTARWGAISPIIVASTSIVWMIAQKPHYLA